MKALTVRLPEALVAEIEAESRERQRSKSEVVRERSLAARPRSRSARRHALADLVGSVDGLPPESVLVDAGFLIALLSRRDRYHPWAAAQVPQLAPPWKTCEAVLSEALHLLGGRGRPGLSAVLRRGAVVAAFDLTDELDRVLNLMQKYADDPVILTTDATFASIAATAATSSPAEHRTDGARASW